MQWMDDVMRGILASNSLLGNSLTLLQGLCDILVHLREKERETLNEEEEEKIFSKTGMTSFPSLKQN